MENEWGQGWKEHIVKLICENSTNMTYEKLHEIREDLWKKERKTTKRMCLFDGRQIGSTDVEKQ